MEGAVCEEIKSAGVGKLVWNGQAVPTGARERFGNQEQWVRGKEATENSVDMS